MTLNQSSAGWNGTQGIRKAFTVITSFAGTLLGKMCGYYFLKYQEPISVWKENRLPDVALECGYVYKIKVAACVIGDSPY